MGTSVNVPNPWCTHKNKAGIILKCAAVNAEPLPQHIFVLPFLVSLLTAK